jgi:plastocyanin
MKERQMRRSLAVLVIAVVGAVCAAPAASAKTKVVFAGGPPPTSKLVPALKYPRALDLNGYFQNRVKIHVGDSVRWIFSRRVVHTVTFLPQTATVDVPDPTHPYTGFADAAGAPFWFNGQPSLEIPPQNAFPQGGGSTDGTQYRTSGLSAPTFKPYQLTFTKAGTFAYLCMIHPGMEGSVRVVGANRPIPSARADRKTRTAELTRALARARQLAKFKPKGNRVVAGHDSVPVSWFRFFPSRRTIRAGQTVHFSISSDSEIHTVAFGPAAYRAALAKELVMVQPQPSGPPRLQFNPQIFLPSDPTLPPYTGTNHGNGFLNTGVMDTDPASPPPPSADITFTTPGTYRFECTVHPGMRARIRVR